jgi:hypothetical protein
MGLSNPTLHSFPRIETYASAVASPWTIAVDKGEAEIKTSTYRVKCVWACFSGSGSH